MVESDGFQRACVTGVRTANALSRVTVPGPLQLAPELRDPARRDTELPGRRRFWRPRGTIFDHNLSPLAGVLVAILEIG